MFTGNTINLGSVINGLDVVCARDGEFSCVGKVPTKLPHRLVPASKRAHLEEAIAAEGVAGIITTEELIGSVPTGMIAASAPDPVAAAFMIHERLCAMDGFMWESFDTRIDPTADIHASAVVPDRNVVIGANTQIMAGAIVCERSIVGARCSVGPGVVVGCDAFEVDTSRSPRRILVQAGGVLLEDDVEVQAKSTLVRSTFGGFTRIGAETKIDCQVHVAHDCEIGQRVRIAACAELSGRVVVGNDAVIGPNCSVSNGLRIGNGATVTIGSVVVRDVADDTRVTGNFAVPHGRWIRFVKSIA